MSKSKTQVEEPDRDSENESTEVIGDEPLIPDEEQGSDTDNNDDSENSSEDNKIPECTEKTETVEKSVKDLYPYSRKPIRESKDFGKEKNLIPQTPPSTKKNRKEKIVPEPKTSSERTDQQGPWIFQRKNIVQYILPLILAIVMFATFASILTRKNIEAEKEVTIEGIKQNFPNQEHLLWRAITRGINDTLKFERPSSYIFLHENEANRTMKALLKDLSQYAVCQVSNCDHPPIELNTKLLHLNGVMKNDDYGVVISKYKEELEEKGVMIIENLDTFPEKFALAFHSFCDEISPLVHKSVFFFTMQVDKFNMTPLYDLRTVENTLKIKWKDLKEDMFEPLFTRISGMLLRVHPEAHMNVS